MVTSERWLTDRPAEAIAGTAVTLRRWSPADVDDIVQAVNDSLEELRPWMPWAQQPATDEGVATVFEAADSAWGACREFSFTIRSAHADEKHSDEKVVGCCGLHDRVGPGALEIGYWVRSGYTGRGVATEAARLLTTSALTLGGVERVEIHCDAANTRSASIPRRLGYRLDRIEHKPAESPGETDRHMIWSVRADEVELGGSIVPG